MNWKFFVSWVPGIPIAIVNGVLREFWYQRFLPELPSHQLSTLSFIFFFGIYVWFIFKWMKLQSAQEALHLGLIWLVLTVAFEFLFGHFVMGILGQYCYTIIICSLAVYGFLYLYGSPQLPAFSIVSVYGQSRRTDTSWAKGAFRRSLHSGFNEGAPGIGIVSLYDIRNYFTQILLTALSPKG